MGNQDLSKIYQHVRTMILLCAIAVVVMTAWLETPEAEADVELLAKSKLSERAN
jgi:hypothetical protein